MATIKIRKVYSKIISKTNCPVLQRKTLETAQSGLPVVLRTRTPDRFIVQVMIKYIDLNFLEELQQKLDVQGDFAMA